MREVLGGLSINGVMEERVRRQGGVRVRLGGGGGGWCLERVGV